MRALYSFLTHITYFFLKVSQLFSKKMKLFIQGRKQVFYQLHENLDPSDATIWMHCASLGEYEQGVPILNALREQFKKYKIVVTFFSPSGYEVKKNSPLADIVTYLPFDTPQNARLFINQVKPSIALFIKYEVWPNYMRELHKHQITTFLISGMFRSNQIYFKWYGGLMRSTLQKFDHFFLQDSNSQKLLETLQLKNTSVSGDTRFDRVSHQIEQDNSLEFMDRFIGDSICIVCGSTWPEDEEVLVPFINASKTGVKFVIAPHKIEIQKIENLRKKLTKKSALFSEKENLQLREFDVLIIDTIGLLTKIYSYAHIAYVGGAMGKTGLHNILEPATFGVPIVIGHHFDKFPEARRLQHLAGLFSIQTAEECSAILEKLVSNKSFREKSGMIAGHFINSNTGATRSIMDHLSTNL